MMPWNLVYIAVAFYLVIFCGCSGDGSRNQLRPHDLSPLADSLYALYGNNKMLPPGFELQALQALSYYPELRDVHIRFRLRKALIPLSSRPYIGTLIRKRENRVYKVVLSDGSFSAMEPYLLRNLPFNAQVAIIGHELAHTSDYQEMGFLQIHLTGLAYLWPTFRSRFEKDTDRRTIKRGLGPGLLEYAEFVREQAHSRGRDTEFIDRYYLSPDEIRAELEIRSVQ